MADLSAPAGGLKFRFPSTDDIAYAQELALDEIARLSIELEGVQGVVFSDGRPWISSRATDLLARLFVVAHCGVNGHRKFALLERISIVKLQDKVDKSVRGCLLCKHVKGPKNRSSVHMGPLSRLLIR